MTRTDRPVTEADVMPTGMGLTKFRDPLRIPPMLRPSPEALDPHVSDGHHPLHPA